MTTVTITGQTKANNKTDAGNGSYGICRVIDASRSPSPYLKRSIGAAGLDGGAEYSACLSAVPFWGSGLPNPAFGRTRLRAEERVIAPHYRGRLIRSLPDTGGRSR